MSNDYRNQDLGGESFRDKDLSGSDFSGADIQGADFTNANLVGADFSYVKTGQRFHFVIALVLLLILLAFLSDLIIGGSILIVGDAMTVPDVQRTGFWLGIGTLIFLLIICLVVAIKGFGIEFAGLLFVGVIAGIVIALVYDNPDNAFIGLSLLFAIVWAVPGVILGSVILSTAEILNGNGATFFFLSLLVLSCCWILIFLQVAVILLIFCLALIGLSFYISKRVLVEDKNFLFIRRIVDKFTLYGGTSFRGANLTDANFECAIVKSADFRGAKLKNINWTDSRFLEYSRFEDTNLEDSRFQRLVVTKNAPDENFDRLDLRGLNLEGANLKNASLIGTDLNETSLKNADLTSAKLVNAQLHKTDLTGATLTGAVIRDWGISARTKFEGVKCEYLYMRFPTEDNPDPWRKPDESDETFQEGDFEKFITPIIETLDYYDRQDSDPHKIAGQFKTLEIFHNEDVDPNTFAVAVQEFSDENPEAGLEVISVEGKKDNKLRLQAKISSEVDSKELKGKYLRKYEEIKARPDAEIRQLVSENEAQKNHINSLFKLVETALSQKNVSIANVGSLIMSEKNVQQELNIKDSTIQGDVSQVVADSIRDSLGKLESAESIGLQEKLKELNGQVADLCKQLPEDKQKQVAQYLQVLTEEATSDEPRKQWYELSAEGLISAAKSVGETAPPIAPTVKAIVAFMS